MANIKLTDHARDFFNLRINPGDTVIDATAGNGYDTLFLASRVGHTGRVYAFDIQERAIQSTRARIDKAGQSAQLVLIQDGHQNLLQHIPVEFHGSISAIMFNLGYLPGSDHQITTQATATLQALDMACELLAPDGLISVIAYTGHDNGRLEAERVTQWVNGLPVSNYTVNHLMPQSGDRPSPVWFGIKKSGKP